MSRTYATIATPHGPAWPVRRVACLLDGRSVWSCRLVTPKRVDGTPGSGNTAWLTTLDVLR